MKHKIRAVEIIDAVKHHNLENDEDIKGLRAALNAEKNNLYKHKQ